MEAPRTGVRSAFSGGDRHSTWGLAAEDTGGPVQIDQKLNAMKTQCVQLGIIGESSAVDKLDHEALPRRRPAGPWPPTGPAPSTP